MSIGIRLERSPQMLPAGTVLRPLRDQIVVKPLAWEPSKLIVIAGNQRKPLRGVVVFVGPGERVKRRWKNSAGQVHKIGEMGQVIPTEVKPGDVVELGGLEIDGYAFQQVAIGHEVHLICQEKDVAGVIE
jgi:co-chaperonin GroES (HSP10)